MENKMMLPVAIIIAGLLIAGAVFLGGKTPNDGGQPELVDEITIDSNDHILGNPDAEIKLVEFSDPQCKFCKSFHPTMTQVMSEYGDGGRVAWVYKHFVIFGEQSVKEASATECAAELGGEEKFWSYLSALFENKDENARLLPGINLEGLAENIGLNADQFKSCLEENKSIDRINALRDEAVAVGGSGTPYTLVTDKDGKIITTINGAQPFERVKAVIDQILSEDTQ